MTEKMPVISNKTVLRDYTVEKTFEAGIQLSGGEVKSLRAGKANLQGSFAHIEKGEMFLYNMHISPYEFCLQNIEPLKVRKLLMHKNEIFHILNKVNQKGYTIVPLKVYFKKRYAKVELALAVGKKLYDKRTAIKEKEVNREIKQALYRRR
ncbi:SmpB protein [Candidatus Omnitrophus magneticus]|uniref:SsrA-binding protein n=1 Tax=Candidatus Omnitrophus magneticus TaxID=1609969 RepID=A0A0F0CUX0_9BACT|nr:SmpB protein [Candidatus Omnitrophus magneticus]